RLLGGLLGLVVVPGEAVLLRPVLLEAEGTVDHPLTRLVPALLAPVLLDAGVGPEVGDLRNRSPVGVNKAPGDLPIRVPFYEFLVDLGRQKGHKAPRVICPRWPKISVYQRSPRPPVWPWRFFSQPQVFTLMCRKFIPLRAILLKQSQSSQWLILRSGWSGSGNPPTFLRDSVLTRHVAGTKFPFWIMC